ncbi:MAG: hypothetical protein DME25_14930 [Verrucomicrobia bacterium]|nr:MAG: hypothetical protein DME25_14930 [Verrucomicrobiota bacterium]
MPFVLAHLKLVRFPKGLGKQADILFDLLVVHFDDRAAEQLIELEFETDLFRLADLEGESHTQGHMQQMCQQQKRHPRRQARFADRRSGGQSHCCIDGCKSRRFRQDNRRRAPANGSK